MAWRDTVKRFIGQVRMLGNRLDCCQPGDEERQLFQKDEKGSKRGWLVIAPFFGLKKPAKCLTRVGQKKIYISTLQK